MSESAKPTNAPWIVDVVTTPNGVGYQISNLWEEGEETHTDEIADVCMDYADGVALANANLLAAAPDLLQASQAAAREMWEFIADFIDEPNESDFRVVKALEAAIAKAEGVAPVTA